MTSAIIKATSNKPALCITKEDYNYILSMCKRDELDIEDNRLMAHISNIFGDELAVFNQLPRYLLDRSECETDPSYLQIIPYTVIFNEDDHVLIYSRGKGGAETRLHAKHSIGFGGHIEEATDEPLMELVKRANQRELEEELNLKECDYRYIDQDNGVFLHHEKDDVGKVHLGVIFIVDTKTSAIGKEEADVINDLRWIDLNDLVSKVKNGDVELEIWSQIIFDLVKEFRN